jgi:hypothetical protein
LDQELLRKNHGLGETVALPEVFVTFEAMIRKISRDHPEGLFYRDLLHFSLGLKLSPRPDITGLTETVLKPGKGDRVEHDESERRRQLLTQWWSALDLHLELELAALIDEHDIQNASGPGVTWTFGRVNRSLFEFLEGLERGGFFSEPVANQRVDDLIEGLLDRHHSLIKAHEDAIALEKSQRPKHWDSPPSAKVIESHEKLLILLQDLLAFWRDHWRGILGSLRENQPKLLSDPFLPGHFFPDNVLPFRRGEPKVGRNDPCPCGSGKKHKHCCGG